MCRYILYLGAYRIYLHILGKVITQVFITNIKISPLYTPQHHGLIYINNIFFQFLRIANAVFPIFVMVVLFLNDNLIFLGIITYFIAKDQTDIIQIVTLGSMYTSYFIDSILRVNPIYRSTVPSHFESIDFNIVGFLCL